jgi:hypothetical protein
VSNYVQSTNFATKDALSSGDPLKIVKGTEINTEFNNIAVAVATKADLLSSPQFVSVGVGVAASGVTGELQATGKTQVASLGVNTAASSTAGEIRATGNITAFFSDDRLKTKLGNIENALDKVLTLSGFYYVPNETAQDLGYEPVRDVGVSAQQVQAVQPEVVVPAPIDANYLTVRYDRLVPLLVEAIKELDAKVKALEAK